MAKKNYTSTSSKAPLIQPVQEPSTTKLADSDSFVIPYPTLWLAALVFLLYVPSLKYGLTELDDSIFIRDFQAFNENLANLWGAFNRGLFDAVKDPYYRPLFSDSMILNYWLADHGQHIYLYHLVNLLLHLTSVILLFKLFGRLRITGPIAFVLSVFFAVHPVLTQAVAWIPGRNDTLLAVFVLSFLILSVDFVQTGKPLKILGSTLFLLAAFFTKETAVFAAPAAFVILILYLGRGVFEPRNLLQYGIWAGCFAIWFFARSHATVQVGLGGGTAQDIVRHLPLIWQYIGKIVLPVNLSVFPIMEDTVNYLGFGGVAAFAVVLLLSPKKDWKKLSAAILLFFLFLLPVLLVPASLNEQTFEHRLYLPMIGILLIFPETFFFNGKYTSGQVLVFSCIVSALLAITTFNHESNFTDPASFWKQASETSPHSAFAIMHMSEYEDNVDRRCALIRAAYKLNPNEKYINFYYAEMLINTNKKDSILRAEQYLLAEKRISNFHKCDFYLARIGVEKNDPAAAIDHLLDFLKTEPETTKEGAEADNNLLVLYLNTNQTNRLVLLAKHMKELGLPVPQEIMRKYQI